MGAAAAVCLAQLQHQQPVGDAGDTGELCTFVGLSVGGHHAATAFVVRGGHQAVADERHGRSAKPAAQRLQPLRRLYLCGRPHSHSRWSHLRLLQPPGAVGSVFVVGSLVLCHRAAAVVCRLVALGLCCVRFDVRAAVAGLFDRV